MANTNNPNQKTLQLLRSTGASVDFVAAKNHLDGQLANAKDGELVTASYIAKKLDAEGRPTAIDEVRTLFAIKRTAATGGVAEGTSYFYDAAKTAEDIKAAVDKIMGNGAEGISLKSLDAAIKAEVTRATAAERANAEAIAAMDLTDTAVDGEFITTVSQTDGKVAIKRGKVASNKVTAVAVAAGAETVAINGDTADAQIKSLGKTLKTVQDNAAKYKVVKLSNEEVAALSDANVKEAYKVVSYVGADAEGTVYTQVGETIKIYKDANLEKAELGTDEDAQKLILTYILADGSKNVVKLDFAAIAFNAEFKDGLQVADNGEISVKRDTTSERFLTVSADGVKLAGVQEAIDNAVAAKNVTAEGDYYITATAAGNKVSVRADVQSLTIKKIPGANSTIEGVAESLVDGAEVATKVASFTNARISEEIAKLYSETTSTGGGKVTVKVTEVNGKISAVNVTETDIASANALTSEVTRAKAAEDKIEASVGLAANGSFTAPAGKNYINGATTVMNAIEKLDAQAKVNADAIDGMDLAKVGGAGKFVQSVKQDNGKVTAVAVDLNAGAVALAHIGEVAPEGAALEATTVQAGIDELFTKMIEGEKVSAEAIAAIVAVLGEDAVEKTADGYKLAYPTDKTGILAGATSFSAADEKLAAAIASLNATKTIDCGTY